MTHRQHRLIAGGFLGRWREQAVDARSEHPLDLVSIETLLDELIPALERRQRSAHGHEFAAGSGPERGELGSEVTAELVG